MTPRRSPRHPRPVSDVSILVVDDEPLARRVLERHIAQREGVTLAGECRDGREAVQAIRTLRPDLVFLDVQMPELGGFEVIREIGAERMPATIFVTAFDEFAVRAFDVHALDYLVKPFTDERLEASLRRALEHRRRERAVDMSERLAALLADSTAADPALVRAPEYLSRLLVPLGDRSVVIDTSDITWVRADDYYVTIHTRERQYLLRETMADLERRLDPRTFLRIHRSAIVNVGVVRELRHEARGPTTVTLRDGTRLPVSRSRRERVERVLKG